MVYSRPPLPSPSLGPIAVRTNLSCIQLLNVTTQQRIISFLHASLLSFILPVCDAITLCTRIQLGSRNDAVHCISVTLNVPELVEVTFT